MADLEYGRDYFTKHFTTEWTDTKNVVVSLYEASNPQVQIGIIEVRLFRGKSKYKDEAYLWNLFVDKNHRHKGYGHALLSDALDLAMLNNCKIAMLEWDKCDSKQWVLDWYVRHGFEEKEFSEGYTRLEKDMANYAKE